MSKLIANLPTKKVWVRKEYLTDFQSGFGEFVEGLWVCAKSIQGRAFLVPSGRQAPNESGETEAKYRSHNCSTLV